MPKDNYPLHPGQTHAQPLYAQIPLEEYENLMDEIKNLMDEIKNLRSTNEMMRIELEKRGVLVVPYSKELAEYEKQFIEAGRKNPQPIRPYMEVK